MIEFKQNKVDGTWICKCGKALFPTMENVNKHLKECKGVKEYVPKVGICRYRECSRMIDGTYVDRGMTFCNPTCARKEAEGQDDRSAREVYPSYSDNLEPEHNPYDIGNDTDSS